MLRPSFLLPVSALEVPVLGEAHILPVGWGSKAKPTPVSPADGLALSCPPPGLRCRVGRFAAERHRRSLTPSRVQTKKVYGTLQAREGG